MNPSLLSLLVCPLCKSKLHYNAAAQELVCRGDRIAFPIRDEIPIMLISKARQISFEEYEALP